MLSVETVPSVVGPPAAPTVLEAPEDPANAAFEQGFLALKEHMNVLSNQASAYYQTLQQKIELAKQAQQHIPEIAQKIKEGQEKVYLSDTLRKFLREHLNPADCGMENFNNPYSQEQLNQVHEAVLSFSTSQLDFVSESQLQIQRTMQGYNTTVTLMNSLQSTLAEMIKAFIQGIR